MLQHGSRVQAPACRSASLCAPLPLRRVARPAPSAARAAPESAKDAAVVAAGEGGGNGVAKEEAAPYIANPYTSGRVSPSMDDGACAQPRSIQCSRAVVRR